MIFLTDILIVDILIVLSYTIYRTNVLLTEEKMIFYINIDQTLSQIDIPLSYLNLDGFLRHDNHMIIAFYQLPPNVTSSISHALNISVRNDAHLYIVIKEDRYFLCILNHYINYTDIDCDLKNAYYISNGSEVINEISAFNFDK